MKYLSGEQRRIKKEIDKKMIKGLNKLLPFFSDKKWISELNYLNNEMEWVYLNKNLYYIFTDTRLQRIIQ